MMARWTGRLEPAVDNMADLRRVLGASWSALWPLDGRNPSVLDRSPMGIVGVYGGVAEWCIDPWSATSGAGEPGLLLTVNPTPALPGGPETLMVLRGASYFHRPPGDPLGPSPVPAPAATDGGKGGEGAPAADTTRYRGMDLTERRALAAGQRVRWVGFRVVYGPAAR
jgi:formylglycine-generating enzyme required for sulfatase activity